MIDTEESAAIEINMTNEEAIAEIMTLEWYHLPFDNTPEMCEKALRKEIALRMAIEALKATSKDRGEV